MCLQQYTPQFRHATFRRDILVMFVGLCLLCLGGCMSRSNNEPLALYLNDHELVGKIWDVKTKQFINKDELIIRVQQSDYLLLGEKHDNVRHHQHQASLIDSLRQQQRAVSVSFEMINDEQGKILDEHKIDSAATLINHLNKIETNWRYERDYQVVFESVLKAGYEIRSANVTREKLSQLIKQGEKKLPDNIKQTLAQAPLTPEQLSDLQNEIVAAHCNMIPVEATVPMVLGQRIWDAVMSLSLLNSQAGIKVLVTGAGHARKDRGVPMHLLSQDKTAKIVSIAFLEVDTEALTVDRYTGRWDGKSLPFDFVWFTPHVKRGDPCAGFKERFEKSRKE